MGPRQIVASHPSAAKPCEYTLPTKANAIAPGILNLAHGLPFFDGHRAAIETRTETLEMPKCCLKVLRLPVDHRASRPRGHLRIRRNEFDVNAAQREGRAVNVSERVARCLRECLFVPSQSLSNVTNVDHDGGNRGFRHDENHPPRRISPLRVMKRRSVSRRRTHLLYSRASVVRKRWNCADAGRGPGRFLRR